MGRSRAEVPQGGGVNIEKIEPGSRGSDAALWVYSPRALAPVPSPLMLSIARCYAGASSCTTRRRQCERDPNRPWRRHPMPLLPPRQKLGPGGGASPAFAQIWPDVRAQLSVFHGDLDHGRCGVQFWGSALGFIRFGDRSHRRFAIYCSA